MSEMHGPNNPTDIRAQAGSLLPRDLRRAHEVILHAIASTPILRSVLYLKGGTLMVHGYGSPRQTTDIDFSYAVFGNPNDGTEDNLKSHFNDALKHTAARLGFADTVMRVQSISRQPREYPDGKFPALKFRIAYARRGSKQERRLHAGQATDVVPLDISFNEPVGDFQVLRISDEDSLLSYSLVDLVTEKYRALLQQKMRKRNRRQDVYDLNFLLRHCHDALNRHKPEVLGSLLKKCNSRNLFPEQESINAPVIRECAAADWNTLQQELGHDDPLPDFDPCFDSVAAYYQQLPWTK